MTAADNLCDVCHINPMIGVAATSIPLSVAFCAECAQRHADPETVFLYWEECGIAPAEHRAPDHCVTFVEGAYTTYRQWWDRRRTQGIPVPPPFDE